MNMETSIGFKSKMVLILQRCLLSFYIWYICQKLLSLHVRGCFFIIIFHNYLKKITDIQIIVQLRVI